MPRGVHSFRIFPQMCVRWSFLQDAPDTCGVSARPVGTRAASPHSHPVPTKDGGGGIAVGSDFCKPQGKSQSRCLLNTVQTRYGMNILKWLLKIRDCLLKAVISAGFIRVADCNELPSYELI